MPKNFRQFYDKPINEKWDYLHNTLDGLGFIPAVGIIADLVNAGVYGARGVYYKHTGDPRASQMAIDTGVSFAAAVPGPFGWAASGARQAKNISNVVSAGNRVKRAVIGTGKFAADTTIQTGNIVMARGVLSKLTKPEDYNNLSHDEQMLAIKYANADQLDIMLQGMDLQAAERAAKINQQAQQEIQNTRLNDKINKFILERIPTITKNLRETIGKHPNLSALAFAVAGALAIKAFQLFKRGRENNE